MTESELKQKIIDKIVEIKELRVKHLKNKDWMEDIFISGYAVIEILEDLLEVNNVQKNKENDT